MKDKYKSHDCNHESDCRRSSGQDSDTRVFRPQI